ncbi:MAG: hypothetical protein LBR74_08525 [Eubacterium sp.]|jgi:hypothetical protein|nr:hypothetical protein [Eubacterium sp.]
MLKKILAIVAAGAIAASAMITSVSAETQTIEKVLYTNDLNVGTVKFQADIPLGSYKVDNTRQGYFQIVLPANITLDYDNTGNTYIDTTTFRIQANSLDINGVKPFSDVVSSRTIDRDFTLKITTAILDNKNTSGSNIDTLSGSIHEMDIAAATANRITIKGTLIKPDLGSANNYGRLTSEEEELLGYADKLRFKDFGNGFRANLSTMWFVRTDSNGVETSLWGSSGGSSTGDTTNANPYYFQNNLELDVRNVSTFDGQDTSRTQVLESQAYTLREKEALRQEGATVELVVDLNATSLGSHSLSYVECEIYDEVEGEEGRPFALMMDGAQAKGVLRMDQIYNELYDIYNTQFTFTAEDEMTHSRNNFIKSAKLVISYDDGLAGVLDGEDALDPEEEPELVIEDEEVVDEEESVEDIVDEEVVDEEVVDEETVDEETVDEGVEAESNPSTGVAIAVVPALIAGAAVVASRKRK